MGAPLQTCLYIEVSMLAPDGMLQGHYRITYTVEERPDYVLYRAIDQRQSLRVLIAALVQPNEQALEDVRTLAKQIESVQVPGLLALRDHFAEGLTYVLVSDDPGGQDLERVARERGGPLPEDEVLRHVERLLITLDALHNRKPPLFIGDLRSTDLWSSPDGDLSLAPFALARHIGNEPSSYRAIELYDPANEPTTATDLYALAAVQYQLLTGWAPPTAEVRAAGTPLNAPRTLNGRISTLTEQMVLRALELRSANRYQQAREMRSALETVRLMAGRSLGASPPFEGQILPADQQPTAAPPPVVNPGPLPVQVPGGPPITPPASNPPVGNYGSTTPISVPGQPAPPTTTPAAPAMPGSYTAANYGPPVAQKSGFQISNGCLIAAVVVMGLIALALCISIAIFGYFWVTGNQAGFLPFGGGNAATGTTPFAEVTATPAQPTNPATEQPTTVNPGPAATAAFTSTRQITETTVGAALYSPNNEYLAVVIGNEIHIYNGETLEEEGVLRGHEGDISELAFSSAGGATLLASGSSTENSIRLWNMGTSEQVALLEGHTDYIRGLAFSPDGSLLASASADKTGKIWDVAGRNEIATLTGHTDLLGNITFSPDGKRIATASRDGTVRLWDAANGQPISGFSFTAPTDPNRNAPYWLTGIAWNPDGSTIAVGSVSRAAYILDANTGEQRRVLEGHRDWIVLRGVRYSPDGRTLATASLDGTVKLWNAGSGTEQATLESSGLSLWSVTWSGNGEQVAASSDVGGTVTVWNARSREVINSLQLSQGLVRNLTYSDDGSVLASGGIGGTVVLHILESGQKITLPGGAPTVQYLTFVGETELVAISDRGVVVLIDLSQQREAVAFEGLDGVALSVASTLDRRTLAAGNEQGDIALWDLESKNLLRTLRGLRGPISNIAFSRDGSRIAAVTNEPNDAPTIALWNTEDGQLLQSFRGHSNAITGLALRADASMLATSSVDQTLRIWDGASDKELRSQTIPEGQGWYSSVAFSPDGSMLATGTMGGQIEFYNPDTGDQIGSVDLQSGSVLALAFRLDGNQLAASTRDGGVWLLEKGG
jgi:WD40 repeat protein/serine/threonine protein kinase